MEGNCQRCGSSRVVFMVVTASGLRYTQMGDAFTEFVPHGLGVTEATNDIRMRWCLECGQIQGQWPLKRSPLEPPPLRRGA